MKSSKNEEHTAKQEDVEVLNFGPVRVERRGRFITMSSHWEENNHKKFLKEIAKKRPNLKAKIHREIQELRNILTEYDSLEVLSPVATYNLTGNEDADHEGRMKGQPLVELALSLSLSRPYPQKPKKPNATIAQQVIDSTRNIIMDVMYYFGSEAAEKKRPDLEERLRSKSIQSHLLIRGKTYQNHYLDTTRELFEPLNDFFNKNWGCQVKDFVNLTEEVLAQVSSNTNRHADTYRKKLEHLHKLFIDFTSNHSLNEFKNHDDLRQKFNALPEVQKHSAELHSIIEMVGGKKIYEIEVNEKAPLNILDLLCCYHGDNDRFMLKDWEGWPQNESVIFYKPIIKFEDRYYCYIPYLLVQNLQPIVERLIRETDPDCYSKRYLNIRSKYLESKSLHYFTQMLPEAKTYKNLFYSVIENGQQKRAELDGMVIYDQNLLLIEGKSAPLSIIARRGGLERMKRDVKGIIAGAYSQCKRTKDYINSEAVPKFYDNQNRLVVALHDKNFFENIFLINVTLDLFGNLATHLNSIKSLGFLDGKEWPWSVYLNDLRAISELIEFPSQFVHYLQRRIQINDFVQFESADELDIFGFYLKEGLYFEEGELDQFSVVTINAYSDDIDAYFEQPEGASKEAKPSQKFPPGFKDIIDGIRQTRSRGFSGMATRLLDLGHHYRAEFTKQYERIISATRKDHKSHNCTMLFNKPSFGLTAVSFYGFNKDFADKATNYCLSKMQQERVESWFCLLVYVESSRVSLDFLFFK